MSKYWDTKHIRTDLESAAQRLKRMCEQFEQVDAELAANAPSERGWLIEKTLNSQPIWWCAGPHGICGSWTGESSNATRFARARDAGEMLRALGFMDARVTEHTWI